jgi:hypothetical protein
MKTKEHKVCSEENCSHIVYLKGMCKKCYGHSQYIKNKEKILIQQKQRYHDKKDDPEFRTKRAEYQKEYKKQDKVKQKAKLYKRKRREDPEFKLREKEIARRYRIRNREKLIARDKEKRSLFLQQALDIYGSKCKQCNNKDIIVLEFHHIDGSGKEDNRKQLLKRIVDSGHKLDNIMLLCANCHIHQDLIDGTGRRGRVSSRIANALKEE